MNYGIELECGVSREAAADALCRLMDTRIVAIKKVTAGYKTFVLENGWRVSSDSSLRRDGWEPENCVEIISPVLQRQTFVWNDFMDVLKEAGATLTPRCGMHIHVDAAHLTPLDLQAICRVVADQNFTIPAQRVRYVNPMPSNLLELENVTEDSLKACWFAGYRAPVPSPGRGRRHSARYRLINLGSVWFRGTLEFRMFDSTLCPHEMEDAFDMIEKILNEALSMRKTIADKSVAPRLLALDVDLEKRSRVGTFSPGNACPIG